MNQSPCRMKGEFKFFLVAFALLWLICISDSLPVPHLHTSVQQILASDTFKLIQTQLSDQICLLPVSPNRNESQLSPKTLFSEGNQSAWTFEHVHLACDFPTYRRLLTQIHKHAYPSLGQFPRHQGPPKTPLLQHLSITFIETINIASSSCLSLITQNQLKRCQ